ncbi:hypothetical protein IBT49_04585 [Erwinia sp. S63]|uniref:hypothetical protein n=1 Tax=Erwinia sp. S63 TaxID=2769341 RepID=UPI00190DB38B|nr:hypothetical protein [Erwinia sp. S63]MBK0095241.1 hypothetical protein [Erwinia sp. S63]
MITDKQILDAFWLGTVKRICEGCINNYIGGDKGLNRDDEFNMKHSTYISTPWMSNYVVVDIGNSQLKRRVNKLVENGVLTTLGSRHSSGSYSARLPDEICWPPYRFALEFMAAKGLTEKPSPQPDIEKFKSELEAALLDKFGNALPQVNNMEGA